MPLRGVFCLLGQFDARFFRIKSHSRKGKVHLHPLRSHMSETSIPHVRLKLPKDRLGFNTSSLAVHKTLLRVEPILSPRFVVVETMIHFDDPICHSLSLC